MEGKQDCSHPKLIGGLFFFYISKFYRIGVVIYFSFRINTIEHDVGRLKAVQVSQSKMLLTVDLKGSEEKNIICCVKTTSLAFLDHFS